VRLRTILLTVVLGIVGAQAAVGGACSLTPLWYRITNGDLETVRQCLEEGEDVNAPDLGQTPIFYAAKSGQLEIARLLLDYGADVSTSASGGHTPLMVAAGLGNVAMVQLLVEAGAGLDVQDEEGRTAVFHAAEADQPAAIEALDTLGADVKLRRRPTWGNSLDTPLMLASARGYTEVVERLLAAGADVDALNSQCASSLFWAAYGGHAATVEALLRGQPIRNFRSSTNTVREKTADEAAAVAGFSALAERIRGAARTVQTSPVPECPVSSVEPGTLVDWYFVAVDPPHEEIQEIAPGAAFRVRLVYEQPPSPGSEAPVVQLESPSIGGRREAVGFPTEDPRVFLSEPILVLPEIQP
jgi:hypothetical protein